MTEDIELTIGSDPEFVIMCGDSVENALEIFQKVFPNVGCLQEKEIEDYYAENKLAYLEYALLNIEFEYLKNNYYKILKKHPVYGGYEAATIILNYYIRKGFPEWDEVPAQVQYRIINLIEEENIQTMEAADTSFCTTELGCDGQTALGELRPKYGNDPIEHFKEILKLMEELNDLLKPEIICYGDDLQVKAGAVQGQEDDLFQLGGHIHLGYDDVILKSYLADYLSFFCGVPLTLITDTEKMFEVDISTTFIKNERDIRHKKGQYGEYGDYREKSYGIEFRMPSSWLVSPQITIGALSLAYVIGYEFLTKSPNEQHIWTEIFKEEYGVHPDKYIGLYKNQNWEILQDNFESIKLEIQQMKLYPKYKEYIDYIFNMIDRNETWHSENNILPRWDELW